MTSWGCPHELDGKCTHVNNVPCDPGMKGCVLFGRFVWADESKNRSDRARSGNEPQTVLEAKAKDSKDSMVQITPANVSDIPELCELLNILFSQEADFKPDHEVQSRGLAAIMGSTEVGMIFVARQGRQIAGMASLLYTVSTALGGRVALLEDMVVSPNVRNSGIGSRLLEHAVHYARLNGYKRITVLTDRANESAQRFYQKHGFAFSAMIPLRLLLNE